jgi:hypothetical protein
MERRNARRWAVGRWTGGLAIAACAVSSTALALSAEAPEHETTVWSPALAAWGARAEAPSALATRPAPVLGGGAPLAASNTALVSVGVSSADALADVSAERGAVVLDETQRWVPAIALQSTALGQKAEGSVDSSSTITYEYLVQQVGNFRNPVPWPLVVERSLREGKVNFFDPPSSIFPTDLIPGTPQNPGGLVLPAAGSNLLLTPTVGMAVELMTPGLQEVPGRPRLFLHGDASTAFSVERSFGREGVPEGAEFPPAAVTELASEVEVKGIGSITGAELRTLLLSGGVGVAFTLDAWERRLRIKPSVEYLRQRIDVRGRLLRAFRQHTGARAQGAARPVVPAVFIPTIDLEANDTLTSYGIGPGLELEMDAARAGPVVLSLFVSGQAYRMLGERDVHLEDSAEVPVPDANSGTDATQPVSAKWDFHLHSWAYRGGLGLRFRWLPED